MHPLIRLYALYALFAGVVTGRLDASEEVSGPSKRVGVAAVVVSNRGGAALEGKQASVEDQVSARLGEMGFRVISREIVQGNLRGFAPLSAPHTKESSTASAGAEAAFLDQASALSLAQNLNADYLLHVSLGSLSKSERSVVAYGTKLVTTEHTLTASYKLLDASAGGSLVGDVIKATLSDQATANVSTVSDGHVDDLIVKVAEQVASSLKVRVAAGQVAKAGTYGLPVKVNIRLECAELSVPDVRVSRENIVLASGAVFPAAPGAAVVEVDGLASGAAPGAIKMRPGFRRVRISRPGFETWERTVNAADGLSLVVPLKITADELERWRQMTLFLTRLQTGAKLTDAQIKLLEGEAARLAASGYRVDVKVDTKENFKFLVPGTQYVSP
jgi:hypothetical protein